MKRVEECPEHCEPCTCSHDFLRAEYFTFFLRSELVKKKKKKRFISLLAIQTKNKNITFCISSTIRSGYSSYLLAMFDKSIDLGNSVLTSEAPAEGPSKLIS